ncbi:hypothetical protein PY650_31800 [Rhizobium calliandrae]|uniref:Branched-chain amino acid transport n=1 Tax=Rhizobium calliandrae TaxID=1312182 RepID=A0ABT7KQ50_9HYPH|nr:hypothetical protein [Rhizobium calliandrae]MDL2410120.1 hypothetical protein [Rhizobium calliandrae]
MLYVLPFLLLSFSLGLSWNRFLLTFTSRAELLENQMPVTMVAATVSLSAFALSVGDKGPWLGGAIVLLGLALAAIIKGVFRPIPVVALSAVSLAAYLYFRVLAL